MSYLRRTPRNVDTVGSRLHFEHQVRRTAEPASFCIAVAGPSGSGKTSIAQTLSSMLPGRVVLLGLDSYYYDLSHLPHAERSTTNFDHPHALEHPLLIEQVCALRSRRAIQKPIYDFASHTRLRGKSETV